MRSCTLQLYGVLRQNTFIALIGFLKLHTLFTYESMMYMQWKEVDCKELLQSTIPNYTGIT